MRTASGVKDTYLDHFIKKLDGAVLNFRGANRQTKLEDEIKNLPPNVFSPIWRLKGVVIHTFLLSLS